MQDIQVQIIDLNGPSRKPGPEFAQMGIKPVQCPSQPIVVNLLGRDAQHLRQHRLGQPVLDLIQRLGRQETIEGQQDHNAAQVDVRFGGRQLVDRLSHLQIAQDGIEQRQSTHLTRIQSLDG